MSIIRTLIPNVQDVDQIDFAATFGQSLALACRCMTGNCFYSNTTTRLNNFFHLVGKSVGIDVSGVSKLSLVNVDQYLLISATSTADFLQSLPGHDLETLMDRFRANFVISGPVEPFQEDGWRKLRIGSNVFEVRSLESGIIIMIFFFLKHFISVQHHSINTNHNPSSESHLISSTVLSVSVSVKRHHNRVVFVSQNMPAYFVKNVSDLYTTALQVFACTLIKAFPKRNTIW